MVNFAPTKIELFSNTKQGNQKEIIHENIKRLEKNNMAPTQDLMFCVADIVKRAKLAKEFKTDSELAAFLGISRSTLSNWTALNSIDFQHGYKTLASHHFQPEHFPVRQRLPHQ